MKKPKMHAICPICGADYTAGSRCDCQQVEIDLDQLPKHEMERLSRTTFQAVSKAFEAPAVQAEYEEWRKNRKY